MTVSVMVLPFASGTRRSRAPGDARAGAPGRPQRRIGRRERRLRCRAGGRGTASWSAVTFVFTTTAAYRRRRPCDDVGVVQIVDGPRHRLRRCPPQRTRPGSGQPPPARQKSAQHVLAACSGSPRVFPQGHDVPGSPRCVPSFCRSSSLMSRRPSLSDLAANCRNAGDQLRWVPTSRCETTVWMSR